MGRECLGICQRYETTGWQGYTRGYKWCARCYLFIKISTVMCPCCNGFLRVSSHTHKRDHALLTVSQKGDSRS